jgi:hypothetical protein
MSPHTGAIRRGPSRYLLVLLLAGAVAASFSLFGASAFPVPSADSHAFVPPAILFAAGGGLRAPLSELTRHLDAQGAGRYLQYPPLFSLILAALLRNPTPRAAFRAIAALNVIDLSLSVLLFVRILRRSSHPLGEASFLTCGIAILGVATVLLGQQTGRPEVLATLWVLLAAHVAITLETERLVLPCGILLGLLGATHPMGGFLLGLVLTLHFAYYRPPSRALVLTVSVLALSLLVFAAILAGSPYGFAETLTGIRRHADIALISRASRPDLLFYWIESSGATFFAFPYLLLPAMVAGRLRERWGTIRSPVLFLTALPILIGTVLYTGVVLPELSYDLLLFAPLVLATNLWVTLEAPQGSPLHAVVPAAHGLAAVGYLRMLVLFGFFLLHGTPLGAARMAFNRFLPERGHVAITPSLWVVSEDYDRMRVFPFAEGTAQLDADVLMIQQTYSGLAEAPRLPGFRLVEDRFIHSPCRILGLTVARTVPGYSYAVYRRTPVNGPRIPS